MKRLLLVALFPFLSICGYAQNTIFGLYGGAGASLKYNYDVGIAGGFGFSKQGRGRMGIGADLFYQSYAFKYDQEAYGKKDGTGNAGVTILNKSSYIFVTPKFTELFGKLNTLEAYVSVGAGFKMSGKETMRKWDLTHGINPGDYDSTLDTSPNINSMVMRLGVGLTEYIYMGKKWWFTVTEDFGFLPGSLSKTSDVHDPSRTDYSPTGKLNPYYISIFIGFRHLKSVGTYYPHTRKNNFDLIR